MRRFIGKIYRKTPEIFFALCYNLWISIRKRRYRRDAVIAKRKLQHARRYLEEDFLNRASNLDRGYLLPEQGQALKILQMAEWHHSDDLASWLR